MLVAVIYAEVPVWRRRKPVGACRPVSLRAEYERAEVAVDDIFDVGARSLAGDPARCRWSRRRRVRQLSLQGCLNRIRNGQGGRSAAEDALRARADEVGRLIPSERQVVPPELGRIQSIALVIDTDAAAPEVVGIAAVGAAALQVDPIEEGAGEDLPIFLEFGTALRGQRREPVVRRS